MGQVTDEKWIHRFTDMANKIASWSKDSTKVGCVVVDDQCDILATGYNGYPRGVDDTVEIRKQRPAKYLFTAHAEANAVFAAARRGVKLEGSTLFLSNLYPHTTIPCAECAKAIVQAGIKRVVCELPHVRTEQWEDHFKVTSEIFRESGVDVVMRHKVDNEEIFMEGYNDALSGEDMSLIHAIGQDSDDYELGYRTGVDRVLLTKDLVDDES
jgi:dCMP deaminase